MTAEQLLTAEQVLAEVDIYCAANGTSVLAPHMRDSFKQHGKMPRAVLVSLNLKEVTRWQRQQQGQEQGQEKKR